MDFGRRYLSRDRTGKNEEERLVGDFLEVVFTEKMCL